MKVQRHRNSTFREIPHELNISIPRKGQFSGKARLGSIFRKFTVSWVSWPLQTFRIAAKVTVTCISWYSYLKLPPFLGVLSEVRSWTFKFWIKLGIFLEFNCPHSKWLAGIINSFDRYETIHFPNKSEKSSQFNDVYIVLYWIRYFLAQMMIRMWSQSWS